jgi:peptidylprolyl isomerase
MVRSTLFVALAVSVAAAGCGNDDDDSAGDSTTTPAAVVGDCDFASIAPGTDLATKPTITIPDCEKPTELQVVDVVTGDGQELAATDTLTAHYVGVSWSTGAQFDVSWDGGEPLQFGLGGVIQGWQQGLVGQKIGGRRLLVIPPDLGYGASGSPPVIAPNETLVFVVDLVSIP